MSSSDNPATFWKKCSSCKKEISFGSMYYLCSVSTCRHKRTGFRFCSVSCWDAHLGYANHRESWAEEASAPSREEFALDSEESSDSKILETTRAPKRSVVSGMAPVERTPITPLQSSRPAPTVDTLVVVSKVKAFIRDQSEFNTSQCFIDALTNRVVQECSKAISQARAAGRKTVMGRDVH
jgi:hypothetical protein